VGESINALRYRPSVSHIVDPDIWGWVWRGFLCERGDAQAIAGFIEEHDLDSLAHLPQRVPR
jgi:hypothetical protein